MTKGLLVIIRQARLWRVWLVTDLAFASSRHHPSRLLLDPALRSSSRDRTKQVPSPVSGAHAFEQHSHVSTAMLACEVPILSERAPSYHSISTAPTILDAQPQADWNVKVARDIS
jgi:hypothetical protein